jgi:hypothetical protein
MGQNQAANRPKEKTQQSALEKQITGAYHRINLTMKYGQFFAADKMQVDVVNTLPALGAGIQNQAVASFMHAFFRGDLFGFQDHFAKDVCVLSISLIQGIHMLVRDHQNMDWRRGAPVPERRNFVIMKHNCGRRITGRNFAKNALRLH